VTRSGPELTAAVFDLGGVLIDWDPRYLYRTLFDDEAAMERFLAEVTSPEWNRMQDAGRPWTDAIDVLAAEHPDQRELIEAFHTRWPEMLGGPIEGTVAVLEELGSRGVRLLGLSNWSSETYPIARERYPFLSWFEAVVISGEIGVTKPDRRIFEYLIDRQGIEAARSVFVDDSPANVVAAASVGFVAIQFSGPPALRRELVQLGMLPPGPGQGSAALMASQMASRS
jgi:2-haloacid dehalogenase